MQAAVEKTAHLSVLANDVVNVNTVMSCPRESLENVAKKGSRR